MFDNYKNLFKNKNGLILAGIIFLAVFFRFFLLGSIPPGLYPDVAVNGMDAIHANETGQYKIFYSANNGREGLFMNMDALVFKAFGTGLWQIRFAGALVGVLTVLGLYFLGKEMFGRRVGIFASLFSATSFWAVNFSRIGFRAVMVPLILVWGSYFLFKGFKACQGSLPCQSKRDFLYYALAGLIFGLGFHTYIAYKAAVLILAIIFGYKIFFEKGFLKENWLKIGIFGFALMLLAVPILYYEQTHKGDAARTGQVSVFNPAVNQGHLVKTLAATTLKGLGMYNFYGDPNARHNFKSLPALNPLVGIAFLIGVYLSFKYIIQNYRKRDNRFFVFCFLVSSFFIMMLPSILTEEGMPHSLRAIGTLPFAFIFAGLGADFLIEKYCSRLFFEQSDSGVEKLKHNSSRLHSNDISVFILPMILGLIILFDFSVYFYFWANNPETRGQFNEGYVEASRYLNIQPDNKAKYVIVNTGGVEVDNLPVSAQTFMFMTYGKKNITYLSEKDLENYEFKNDSIAVIAKKDDKLIKLLNLKNPESSLYTYNPGEPNEFYVFKIKKAEDSFISN